MRDPAHDSESVDTFFVPESGVFVVSRGSKAKQIDPVIDRGAARLDTLPETDLAARVQKLAAATGRWRINRVNDNWVLLDKDGHVDFEDSSLGSVAFLLGIYADVNEKPDTVIKRYYGDLFEGQE